MAEHDLPAWLKTSAALLLLEVDDRYFRALDGLDSKREQKGIGPPVSMYRTSDLLRVKALMREARLSTSAAVRVVVAQNEGRL